MSYFVAQGYCLFGGFDSAKFDNFEEAKAWTKDWMEKNGDELGADIYRYNEKDEMELVARFPLQLEGDKNGYYVVENGVCTEVIYPAG